MHSSYAMMASKVTPPLDEEEEKVDGVEQAGGVTVLVRGRFSRSWASLHQTDTTLMAPMMEK